ncbi:sigma-70 family RNA polymerase sigma factor [Yinghuangia soli]|uniref:Sigma-70 family RNA polymerase sigma factor n=1 Tax=Yinghuangia soli TaxID=2908204 RepID=A0AA41U388_9ACTN|nr:sigma-70 family RNA polymerase sigma factor [Yinghuangia soli]MCF2532498.1 sigma-70 family RNA polymerase sigma factor [Yinghuangia soli]
MKTVRTPPTGTGDLWPGAGLGGMFGSGAVEQLTDERLIAAARDGDREALDRLVGDYLPLVYNIVGRALRGGSDVDDVVQETMLGVVRGLPGLRDPGSFRSWLVAVAMNQVRHHGRQRNVSPVPLETALDVADPGADFADLTILELGLSGQRREVARATAWLGDDDRHLLSLWWLVAAGQLTRTELADALETDAHVVTVRVARMKAQLELSRAIVRALDAVPRCPELADAALRWHGRPDPLWRKRFARHMRDCARCEVVDESAIPAERLLAYLSLVPIPVGLGTAVAALLDGYGGSAVGHSAAYATGVAAKSGVPAAATAKHSVLLKAAGMLAAVVAVGGAIIAVVENRTPARPPARVVGPVGPPGEGVATGGPTTALPTALVADPPVIPVANPATVPVASPTAVPATVPATGGRPTPAPTTSRAVPAPSDVGDQVLASINRLRAGRGLAPLTRVAALDGTALAHVRLVAAGCGKQSQCGNEPNLAARVTAAGVKWARVGECNFSDGPATGSRTTASLALGMVRAEADMTPNPARAGFLDAGFTRIGIAVLVDKSGMVWMTHDFAE